MQPELDFGRDHRVTEAYRRVLRVVGDAVDAIGLMVAAGACGCRTPELSDVLAGRSGRYLRVEWLLAIAEASPPDFRALICGEWLGFVPQPIKPLTEAEKRRRLEERIVAKFGPAGLELVEENRR
jgi:hypothetical protein